jgi:GTP-binding protein
MGHRFLRHVERTRIILHLVDPSPHLEPDPLERFDLIIDELASYDGDLVKKPMLAVITKMDIPENRENGRQLKEELTHRGYEVHEISAATRHGLKTLMQRVASMMKQQDDHDD